MPSDDPAQVRSLFRGQVAVHSPSPTGWIRHSPGGPRLVNLRHRIPTPQGLAPRVRSVVIQTIYAHQELSRQPFQRPDPPEGREKRLRNEILLLREAVRIKDAGMERSACLASVLVPKTLTLFAIPDPPKLVCRVHLRLFRPLGFRIAI